MKSLAIKVRCISVPSLFAVFALMVEGVRAQSLWNESLQGDLSGDYLLPNHFLLSPGQNTITGSLAGLGSDQDFFTLRVPEGLVLSSIMINSYTTGNPFNVGFFGIQQGATLSSPPSVSFSEPIGYVLFGTWAVGLDVLPTIVAGPPFDGERPLAAGQYAVWLNETGSPSSWQLDFTTQVTAVPEPSVGLLAAATLSGFGFRRRGVRRTADDSSTRIHSVIA